MARLNMPSLMLAVALTSAGLYYLLKSARGIEYYAASALQLQDLQQQVQLAKNEVKQLEDKLHAWQHDSFQQERFFRQELAMGYTSEVVYLAPADNRVS